MKIIVRIAVTLDMLIVIVEQMKRIRVDGVGGQEEDHVDAEDRDARRPSYTVVF
ncbi:MAG: hypothetical protein ACQEWV_22275 [Bacillota bacterium]